jgi:hypothetical protein
MAEAYKILGQLAPSGTTETVLYVSPLSTETLVTNITVTNRGATTQTFDIYIYQSVVSNGTTSPAVNSLYKNISVAANTTVILQPGITLPAQNTIVAKGNSNLTISAYGVELS